MTCPAHVNVGGRRKAGLTSPGRIDRNPDTDASRALLAAAYGQMGLIEEAREAWRGLMSVNPEYSVEHRRRVLPYKNPADFEPFVEGLREAGLPE